MTNFIYLAMRFVKIEYTGRIVGGPVFDTTSEETAKAEGVFDEKKIYHPLPVLVGEGQVIAGLDEALAEMKVGDEKKVEIPPEKAYGSRDESLVRLVPLKVFKKQKITPFPGMPVELDGQRARVQTVAGGRVRVDFNNELAGKTLEFEVKVASEAGGDKEKAEYLVERSFNSLDGIDVKVSGKKIEVALAKEVYRDRNIFYRKAAFSADAFHNLKSAEVTYTESWLNPEKEKKEEKPAEEEKKQEKAGGEKKDEGKAEDKAEEPKD